MPAVADAGQGVDARLDQLGGRPHVHHLGGAGIADRAGAAHDQQGALVDAERGIVDPRVIILGSVEHDHRPFERLGIVGIGEIALAKLLRDHRGLHDRAVEQIAAQHEEAGLGLQRPVVRADHPLVLDLCVRGNCRRCCVR